MTPVANSLPYAPSVTHESSAWPCITTLRHHSNEHAPAPAYSPPSHPISNRAVLREDGRCTARAEVASMGFCQSCLLPDSGCLVGCVALLTPPRMRRNAASNANIEGREAQERWDDAKRGQALVANVTGIHAEHGHCSGLADAHPVDDERRREEHHPQQ